MYMVPYYIRLMTKTLDYILKQTDWMWLYFLSDVSFITIKSESSLDSPIPALRNSRLPGPSDPGQEGTEVDCG